MKNFYIIDDYTSVNKGIWDKVLYDHLVTFPSKPAGKQEFEFKKQSVETLSEPGK